MSAREKPFSSEEYARAAIELASTEAHEALPADLEKKVRGDALAFLASQTGARSISARTQGASTTVSTTLSVAESSSSVARSSSWWWGLAAAAAVLLWWMVPRQPSQPAVSAGEAPVAVNTYVIRALGLQLNQDGARAEVTGTGQCTAQAPCEIGVEVNGQWSTLAVVPGAKSTHVVVPVGENLRGRWVADPSKTFPLERGAR